MKSVTFWSEGTRLAGDLYLPGDFAPADRRPAVVMCHGWGGTKEHLAGTGIPQRLADAGYVTLAFDYRGWGESESKVVVRDPLPKERTETAARVNVIREVVDPFDELWDISHALDFIQGEPGVDADRIGLWGSSFGGGLVVWMAAHDPRVKCVVSQVAAQDARQLAAVADSKRDLAIRQARGEAEPVPQAGPNAPGLNGVPHIAKMHHFAPIEYAEQIRVPVLMIDAEHEELFDRHQHSEALYKRMTAANKAMARYQVVPGIPHYAIYDQKAAEAARLAIEWFDTHLAHKGARATR